MKVTAMIYNGDGRLDYITGITNAEMTHEDYMRIINGLRRELKEEKAYNRSLCEMNQLLERQNKRLVSEKLQLMNKAHSHRSLLCIKSK